MVRKVIQRFSDIGEDDGTSSIVPVTVGVVEGDSSGAEVLRPSSFKRHGFVGIEPEKAEQTALIRRVWGDAILADPGKVTAIIRTQSVMAEESGNMLKSALSIGRALLELKSSLSREEFARGLRRSAEAFRGWSSGNISKIMAVAEFVQQADVSISVLPQSYTTLYELTTLDDVQLERAKNLELLRPDVRRSDIVEFKKRVETLGGEGMSWPQLDEVEAKIRRLQAELAQARRERTKILGQMPGNISR